MSNPEQVLFPRMATRHCLGPSFISPAVILLIQDAQTPFFLFLNFNYLSSVTPFKFTGSLNTTMPDGKSSKKPSFDLKASLARPVTWRAHKGKLKPVGDTSYAGQHNSGMKAPKVASRLVHQAVILPTHEGCDTG